jgi:CubicO group peptidase (beta-lactamase class C family)
LDAPALAAIDDAVAAEVERTRQPGLTLGITDRDGTLTVRTYGFAEVASQRPVTPQTLFEIGSIGKTFTAIAVLQLRDEGRLDLHAPVTRYLPWFEVPQVAGELQITVAHLLSHTAGIVAGIDGTPEAAFQVWSLRDLVPGSPPGARFHYSNVGYKALGLVIEALEGRPYADVIRTRILDPLGMSSTEPAITHEIRARLAVGYEYLHDDRFGYPGAPLTPATWLETATADGSIASTAGDMCVFARMVLRGGDPVPEMSVPHARLDETATYGYGLAVRDVGGRRIVGHGGGMVGYLASLQADPEAGLAAVVLQNGPCVHPMALARTVIGIVRDGTTAPRAASNAPHEGVTGAYGEVELVADNDGLLLRAGGREVMLDELDDDLFVARDSEFDEFPLHVQGAELWHGGRRYLRAGATASAFQEPSAELRAIEGQYRSHNPWTTNFRVVLRGDQPWLVFAAAPDGFDDQQPLAQTAKGLFRVGTDPRNPEHLRFDTVIEGRALRAWLSGWPYYRASPGDRPVSFGA